MQNFKTFTAEAAIQKKAQGEDSTLFGATPLARAIGQGEETKAVELIQSMPSQELNQVSILYMSPDSSYESLLLADAITTSYLSMCAFKVFTSAFQALLDKKVDPNVFDESYAYTTLEILVDNIKNKPVYQDEKINLLKLLLKNTDPETLNINRKGKDNLTPLHRIVRNDSSSLSDKQKQNVLKAIELLLEHGAQENIQDDNGATPILFAARDFPEAAALLLRKDHRLVASRDRFGCTILFYAFHAVNPDMVWIKYLSGMLKSFSTRAGELPLNFLLNRYDSPVLGKLLQNHLVELIECLYVPNKEYFLLGDYLERTSLLILAIEKIPAQLIEECINYLLEKPEIKSDINYLQNHGTALHSAVRRDAKTIIELLLKHGADPELTTQEMPLNPLMFAIKEKKAAAISTLLNHYLTKENAKSLLSRMTDQEGNSLLHIAASHHHPEIYDLILEFYRHHAPQLIKLENNEGKTAHDLLPREIVKAEENARQLLKEEKKEISQAERRAQIIANVEQAKKQAAAEEKFQKFLKKNAQKNDEISLSSTKVNQEEQEAATAADVSSSRKRFFLTKALKTFIGLAANPENTVIRDYFLEKQGYFDDLTKPISHERRARARFYQSLKAKGLDDETANQIVIQAHSFPLPVIKTVLLSSLEDDPLRTEKTGIKADYTDKLGTHHGTYELYWHQMPDGTQQIYHSLFKGTGFTPSKKAAASADEDPTDATSAGFNLVGNFRQEKIELPDKTIYTITDKATETIYTLEIPK